MTESDTAAALRDAQGVFAIDGATMHGLQRKTFASGAGLWCCAEYAIVE